MDFPDRRGVNKAYIIAEENAKAQFVRFMGQEITSSRIVEELDASAETARRNKSDAGSTWSKENVRNVQESLTVISSSVARGTLQGVRILAREYNEDLEEVTVIIGINNESQTAAIQLSKGAAPGVSDDAKSEFPEQDAERRVSSDIDDF